MLQKLFKLQENKTDVRTEVMAGITTFMTMAYIIFVNPSILSIAKIPFGAVMFATCISAAFGTILMSLLANYPFALAPGMGLNAFFTFTVVLNLGLPWQAALAAVFISGLIFLLLTLTKAREAIVNHIPMSLKLSVGVGIGLFIALIGLKNAGIVVPNSATLVQLVSPQHFTDPELAKLLPPGTTVASVLLAVFGVLFTGALVIRGVNGALFYGIIVTTLVGIPFGVTKIPADFKIFGLPENPLGAFLAFDFRSVFEFGIIPIIFAFTFVDLFDTIGTLVGVSTKANMLNEKGELPRANQALLADSLATMFGAAMGTSTVTTYVESAAGVAAGGRTGLTSLVTALLFLVAIFFAPLVGIIPAAATAPALIIVGIFMMEPVTRINFTDFMEAIPAFFTIVAMPFTFSIAEGIVAGVLSYTILRILTGRAKEINTTMWVLSVLFVIRFFLH